MVLTEYDLAKQGFTSFIRTQPAPIQMVAVPKPVATSTSSTGIVRTSSTAGRDFIITQSGFEDFVGTLPIVVQPEPARGIVSPAPSPPSGPSEGFGWHKVVTSPPPPSGTYQTAPIGQGGVVVVGGNVYGTYQQQSDEQLSSTRANYAYVSSLPPGTVVTLESGERISREELLRLLSDQRQTILMNQQKVAQYEREGYIARYDEQGNLVFVKQQSPLEVVDESQEQLRQAQIEYQSQDSSTQFTRALFASVTMFPKLVKDTISGIINNVIESGGLVGGNIYGLNPRVAMGLDKDIKKSGQEIILKETEIWHIAESKDVGGFVQKGIIESPAMTDIIIPFTAAAVLTPIMGTIGSMGSGAIKLTGFGASAVKGAASVFPYVAGGVFMGLAISGPAVTYAYEQKKLIESGSTIKSIVQLSMQFTSATAGYMAVANWKPTVGVSRGEYGELIFRKHLTTFHGKPILAYGKPIVFAETVGGITRVVSPFPSKGGLSYQTVESFLKGTPSFESPPVWGPKIGLVPSSISHIAPVGTPSVVPFSWGGKTFVMTGADMGWQPVVDTKLIVRPATSLTEPYKSVIKIPKIIKWQPSTGLSIHPSKVKTVDELFDIYRKGKITTGEYQQYRDVIKADEIKKVVNRISPLDKPVFKPGSPKYRVKPIKMDVDRSGLIRTEWYGKTHVETGMGWQPKTTSVKALSTKVWPKPVVTGPFGPAYSTRFVVMVYEPAPIVSVKPKIVDDVKSEPIFKNAKDILKSDKDIEKTFGGGQVQKDGQKTITIQETKKVSKQLVKPVVKTQKDVIVSPLSKEIVVPESLLKPVNIRKTETLTDLLKGRFQEYKPVKLVSTDKVKGLLFGTLSMQGQKKQQVRLSAVSQEKSLKEKKALAFLPVSMFDKEFIMDTVYDYEHDLIRSVEPISPIPLQTVDIVKLKTPRPPPPRFGFKFPETEEKGASVPTAFQVWVRPRQYIAGKRVHSGTPYPLSSKAYAREDALAVGAHKIGNTAKATFFLHPVSKKPSRRPRSVKPWHEVMLQYDEKDEGRFVELSRFRIDSPGEIREISMRGWNSPHKRKRRRKR